MNKKLLAIAVGAAMVAGATAATAGDEPTFYGKLHLSIDSMDNGASAPNDDDGTFVSSNSSRLGIKGKVALDNGMNAVYKYEMSTNYSSNADVDGDRNAYLGLNSGNHTVVAGRHDMAYKTVGRKFDLFGDTIGDNRTMTRLNDSATNCGCGADWADRRDNVIMYTGQFDAVGVKVMYAPEEGNDDTSDQAIGIDYKGGPIKVMFAHEVHGKGNRPGGTDDSTGDVIGVSYKMGNMKFLATYNQVTNVAGAGVVDASGWSLGGAFKFGMNTLKIQYTTQEFDVSGTSDLAGAQTSAGLFHDMSKKTSVYAVYTSVSNDDNVVFSVGRGTGHDSTVSAGTPGDGGSGFSLGMIHKF